MKNICLIICLLFLISCSTVSNSGVAAKTSVFDTNNSLWELFPGEKRRANALQTLYLPLFVNYSPNKQLASRLHYKLQLALNQDGRVQVKDDKKEAKLWLEGSIVGYTKTAISYNSLNVPRTYRIVIFVNLILKEHDVSSAKSHIILEKNNIRFDTDYSIVESKYIVLERLLDGLTDRIVATIFDGWYAKLKDDQELNKIKVDNVFESGYADEYLETQKKKNIDRNYLPHDTK